MPAGLRLSEEYGDAINVLFVEVQGADDKKVERFALQKKWLGTNAMWTTEPPFNVGLKGIPNFALLDASGKVMLKGYSSAEHQNIVKMLEAEVKSASKGPSDMPKSLRKSWKAFHKGDLAKGIAEADKIAEKGKDDAAAAADLAKDLRKRAKGQVARAKWMIENGYLVEADEMVDDLVKGLKGEDELAASAEALREELDADHMKVEMDAAKQFAKVEAALYEDGVKARGIDKKLEKVAKKYEGTKAAARARHLLDLIG